MISLRPTASPENVLRNLKHLHNQLLNLPGAGSDTPSEWRAGYVRWTNDASDLLRTQLRQTELDHLVTSRRYWALLSMPALGMDSEVDRNLRSVIRTEVQERITAFESAVKDLEQELGIWQALAAPIAAVLDTNVLHEHHTELASFPWNERLDVRPNRDLLLLVPIAVVDELDRQKLSNQKASDGTTPLRTRARAALKTLDELVHVGRTVRLAERAAMENRSAVHIRLLSNDLDHTALDDPDSEIIDRALTLQPFASELRLVTYDFAMAFRARHAGVEATRLSYKY